MVDGGEHEDDKRRSRSDFEEEALELHLFRNFFHSSSLSLSLLLLLLLMSECCDFLEVLEVNLTLREAWN
jgi:hypothetical protein